jgi:hypothetical protein
MDGCLLHHNCQHFGMCICCVQVTEAFNDTQTEHISFAQIRTFQVRAQLPAAVNQDAQSCSWCAGPPACMQELHKLLRQHQLVAAADGVAAGAQTH